MADVFFIQLWAVPLHSLLGMCRVCLIERLFYTYMVSRIKYMFFRISLSNLHLPMGMRKSSFPMSKCCNFDEFRPYKFTEGKYVKSKETIRLAKLDSMVYNKYVDMRDLYTFSRIQSLLICYHNVLQWVLEDLQKIVAQHALSTILQKYLFDRLRYDLRFSCYNTRKEFKGLTRHSIKLAEA